jgi:hypothetical protein
MADFNGDVGHYSPIKKLNPDIPETIPEIPE